MIVEPATPIICLMGPTASGKTDLAITLSEQFNCGLISVDSALVYRGLNIGTAKPESDTLERWPHALVDIVEAWQPYSVADFCRDAHAAIQRVVSAGKVPLLVGGTMLYFRALTEGMNELPASNPSVRVRLHARLEAEGLGAMRSELARIDPAIDARLAANDRQRTMRALEVWHATGRRLSEWQSEPFAPLLPVQPLNLALWPEPRAELHGLIEKRFDAMLAAGFLDEVKQLRRDTRVHKELPSMRSVGYRQAWQFLDGECDFDAFRGSALAATRQLAKRQFTWLRKWPGTVQMNPYAHDQRVHPFESSIEAWLESTRD